MLLQRYGGFSEGAGSMSIYSHERDEEKTQKSEDNRAEISTLVGEC